MWALGTLFQLCCCVSIWFWWEIGVGVTYLLSVQYSCAVVSFFCCGGKANLVWIFLLNPNFLFQHRNRYLEGMDDGQNIPHGHPDFHFYVKLNVFHIPDIFLVNTLLLYSLSPYSQTERQNLVRLTLFYSTLLTFTDGRNHRQRNELILCGLGNHKKLVPPC